jgi:hypothetical protein
MSSDKNDEMPNHGTPLGEGVMKGLGDTGDLEELPDDMLDDPDLALLTDYLSHQLPPEEVEAVERRLQEDDAFWDLAEPLIAAWSVPPKWQREPMSQEELARSWDRFTKRVGFVHQRRKARRRRWLIVASAVLAAVGVWGWIATAPIRQALASLGDFVPVADSGGWMTVGQTRVKLEPGAKLAHGEGPMGLGDMMELDGAARFVYDRKPLPRPGDSTALKRPEHSGVTVVNDAGAVTSMGGDFRVHVRPGATDVEVYRRTQQLDTNDIAAMAPDMVVIYSPIGDARLLLAPGEIGRIEAGRKPVKVREVRDPAYENHPVIKILRKADSTRRARSQ